MDLSIAADAEATLPALIEACKKLITADRKARFRRARREVGRSRARNRQRDLEQAAFGFDASPLSTARMSAELWNQIKTEDWSLVSDVTFFSYWPRALWDFTSIISTSEATVRTASATGLPPPLERLWPIASMVASA